MKPTHIAAFAAVFTLASSQLYAQDVAFTPDQLKFNTNPATGSQIAVVMGDPGKPGPFIMRVRYPAGLKSMPHSHPNDTLITVLSGTFRHAEGTTFDETKLKDYPAGSFILQRANVPHYEMANSPMEFEAHGTGPQAFIFVDPKHDPKNR
jgi:quercetin dioxygenase-like cupin family protein